jgi:hypothetical protein
VPQILNPTFMDVGSSLGTDSTSAISSFTGTTRDDKAMMLIIEAEGFAASAR